MLIISMLYGIIIRMYLLDNKHHNLPHFNAVTRLHHSEVKTCTGTLKL